MVLWWYGLGRPVITSEIGNWSVFVLLGWPVIDHTDPWTDKTSRCWHLEEHHYAEVFAVCASFKTDDPPLWSALLSPSARGAALRENREHCLNCHEDAHSFRNCRHPFINASGCLNPELRQLGSDDAYRRWQSRMTSYRRGKSRTHPKDTVAVAKTSDSW